jgi:hypothetical protein
MSPLGRRRLPVPALLFSIVMIWLASLGRIVSRTSLGMVGQHQQLHSAQSQRSNNAIYFVHIGKSGGETIKNVLAVGCHSRFNRRKRDECLLQLQENESQLSKATTGYLHCFNGLRNNLPHASGLLISLRHPLDRTKSWYDYVHPNYCLRLGTTRENCYAADNVQREPTGFIAQFFQCFATFPQLARPTTPSCQTIARAAMTGHLNQTKVPLAAHLIANIRVNYQLTAHAYPDKPVYVVRTDSLWSDMAAIDRMLGGHGNFQMSKQVINSKREHLRNNTTTTNDDLTEEERRRLCCMLQVELQVYKILVERAANLNASTKNDTIQDALGKCNMSNWDEIDACDENA